MNEKTFISLKEILQSGLEEEVCVNVRPYFMVLQGSKSHQAFRWEY